MAYLITTRIPAPDEYSASVKKTTIMFKIRKFPTLLHAKREADHQIERFSTPGTLIEVIDSKTLHATYRVHRDERGIIRRLALV